MSPLNINRMFLREATTNGKGYIADMYEMHMYGSHLRRVIHKKREKNIGGLSKSVELL